MYGKKEYRKTNYMEDDIGQRMENVNRRINGI